MSRTLLTLRGKRTRGAVSQYTGIPASSLADLEKGKLELKAVDYIFRLADYYGVTAEYIYRGIQKPAASTALAESTTTIVESMRDVSRSMSDGLDRVAALMDELERKRTENLSAAQKLVDALAQEFSEEELEEILEALLAVARGDTDAGGRLAAALAFANTDKHLSQQT